MGLRLALYPIRKRLCPLAACTGTLSSTQWQSFIRSYRHGALRCPAKVDSLLVGRRNSHQLSGFRWLVRGSLDFFWNALHK